MGEFKPHPKGLVAFSSRGPDGGVVLHKILVAEDGSHWDEFGNYYGGGQSMARQSEAEGCDINKIMKRYEQTGVLPDAVRQGLFVDVSEMGDYRTAIEQVRSVDRYFASLPAATRAEFENNPAVFLDFAADPGNEARLRELGIIEDVPAAIVPVKAAVAAAPAEEARKAS